MNATQAMEQAAEQIRNYPDKLGLLYRLLGWFEGCIVTNPEAAREFAKAVDTLIRKS